MTRPGTGLPQWALVDEGWDRKAVDFATRGNQAVMVSLGRPGAGE